MDTAIRQSELTFEGPLSLTVSVVLSIGLLLLFLLLLWRETRVTRGGTALLFLFLRTVAMIAVVWMLLAATSVTFDREDSTPSVLLAVDVSPSMLTRDPTESVDGLRWDLASDDSTSSVAACDRAVVAAVFVRHQLSNLVNSASSYRPPAEAHETLCRCAGALERVEMHCEAAASLSDRGPSRAPIEEVIERLEAAGDLIQPVVKGWNGTLDVAQIDQLAEAEPILAGIEYQLRRAAAALRRDVDEEAGNHNGGMRQKAGAKIDARVERVADVLDRLQGTLEEEKEQPVAIRSLLFDSRAMPLGEKESLREQINARTRVKRPSSTSREQPQIGTDLGAALRAIRDDIAQNTAAVVMFTDAAHNETTERDPWEIAESADVPIHVVPIGSTERLRDLVLYSLVAPPVVMEGDDVVIEAHIRAHGCVGESSVVELLRDGEVIDYKQVEFHADPTSRHVTFSTELAESGTVEFEVNVGGIAREQSDTNNTQKVRVNVTRRNIRVLLVDGRARWEFKYLRELFRRDDTVDCDELVFAPRVLGTGFREGTPRLPETVDEWAEYDVAILGDIPPDHLTETAQQSLEEFVSKRDGTIVIIAGDQHMPVAFPDSPLVELIPTQRHSLGPEPEDGYRLVLTPSGRRHRALTIADDQMDTAQTWEFVSRNVPVYALSEYSRPKPSADTLIEAVPTPETGTQTQESAKAFLCWHSVGGGRVVYLSSPDTWRLRFRRGDQLHHRFWGQLLRWALARELSSGSELVQIRTERSHYDQNEQIEVTVTMNDPSGDPVVDGSVTVTAENQDSDGDIAIELTADEAIPGRYEGQFESLDAGNYLLTPAGNSIASLSDGSATSVPSTEITVRPVQHAELMATQCRLDVAQRIAEVSGGQVIPPTAVAEILALSELQAPAEETRSLQPIWPQWKYFWVVFVCLNLEWGIRKWKGLP